MRRFWLISVALLFLISCEGKKPAAPNTPQALLDKQNAVAPAATDQPKMAKIGEPVQGGSFTVTVSSAEWQKRVLTGSSYTSLRAEQGISYLVMVVTFKNTGTEAAPLFDGTLYIRDEQKTFTFDTSETILEDGWGLFLDKVNPLVTKKTRLVYKVSNEIHGTVSWLPHEADTFIVMGNI